MREKSWTDCVGLRYTKIEGCDCGGAGQCSGYCSACAGFCVKLDGIKDIKVAKAKEVAAPPDATDTSDAVANAMRV